MLDLFFSQFQPDDINRQPVRQPVQQPPHQQPQEHHQPPHQQIPEHHSPQEPQADLQQNDVEVMRQEEHHPDGAKSDEPAPPEHPASVEQPAQPG